MPRRVFRRMRVPTTASVDTWVHRVASLGVCVVARLAEPVMRHMHVRPWARLNWVRLHRLWYTILPILPTKRSKARMRFSWSRRCSACEELPSRANVSPSERPLPSSGRSRQSQFHFVHINAHNAWHVLHACMRECRALHEQPAIPGTVRFRRHSNWAGRTGCVQATHSEWVDSSTLRKAARTAHSGAANRY